MILHAANLFLVAQGFSRASLHLHFTIPAIAVNLIVESHPVPDLCPQARSVFPALVSLPLPQFKLALNRLLQVFKHTFPCCTHRSSSASAR